MTSRQQIILQRRQELLAKIALQRDNLAQFGAGCAMPLALADRGVAAYRYVRSHPLLLVMAGVVVVLRRGRLIGTARSAWRAWNWYRSVKSYSQKIVARLQTIQDLQGANS